MQTYFCGLKHLTDDRDKRRMETLDNHGEHINMHNTQNHDVHGLKRKKMISGAIQNNKGV